ncbi:alpha/beta hydrolase [Bradyrhizobium viridifuturi]|uniref:alpha/beta fold hydrolase n=1 Tax=Bradyrhizobium sp. TaxID=376 RepID=UPI0005535906|nr:MULTISPECIES: alpha/beta hydrolase [Bradyrhizobium]QRI73174.1 alpha/beta hydrolase [Bradyrhizobium sp. PSBB068]MBR1020682.1 alpha/beta hydrolase [Bradyrhizobium viridifuturi]MBR1039937.1 alpha/beta hydrolase [Bradyrhizobium viridifuturi]MBR1043658.1 alpha/beta hydrolase [Bradyrhizobium viridifuturi]MBR1076937.1 alpha/beta hydrolase [Bradyrhizobium viridifuturi]
MAIIALATAGLALALATQIGVVLIQRAFPPQGRMIDVAGARLHVVELGPRDAAGPPIVMLHGASSNLRAMQPLGERIAKTRRVILIDRPGHGWSTRERVEDSTPAIQGRMIVETLTRLGVDRAIVVAHSWAGALALRIALDHPDRVAGLVLLAPVAYPWRGGAGRYNDVISTPLIGPLLAHTITLPLGLLVASSGASGVFAPQPMPDDFVRDSATLLLLRPREFIANARDLVTLKAAVVEQAPRYAEIKAPLSIVSGDVDKTVTTGIHSRLLAATAPQAKLIVLPGVGHMVQYAAPDLVASEIEAMAGRMTRDIMTAQ